MSTAPLHQHTTRSVFRSAFTVLAVGAVVTTGTVLTTAAPAAAEDTTAVVRSAHFSPDTAGVDVYLAPFSGGSTTLWVSDEGYGAISDYQRIAPGAYVVSMRAHGAPASSTPTLTWTLDAKPGAAYTAAAIGTSASLQAVILNDELTPPAAGTGRVRVVQAASAAPVVSVEANGGVVLADKLAFGTTSAYQTVPTGAWDVRVTANAGSASPVTTSVAVPAGSSSTVVVLDGKDGSLTVNSVQDSASSGVMPVGSVDAGGGGTATSFDDSTTDAAGAVWGVAVLVVTGAAAAGAVAWTRRRRVAS